MNLIPQLIRKQISSTGALSRNLLLATLLGGFGLQASAQTFRSNHQVQIGGGASMNSAASDIPVPGKANPWLADATTAGGGDTAPDESPVIVSLVDFVGGDELVFTATGGTSYAGGDPSPTADGDLTGYRGLYHLNNAADGGPENNIGGLNSPANALVGVFLGPNPSGGAPSTFYDFSPDPVGNVPGSIDYTTLAPPIAKPFFIGDGVNSSSVQQRITVPVGATRLVLGSMDGVGWYNNTGSFSVTVALAGEPGDSDVRATLSAPASITIGSNITYQFRIHNNGPSTATGVKVSFQPSSKESFVSATVPYTVQIGGPADGYYFINLPNLTSGATNNFNFVFKANAAGQITLAGGSSSTSNDPNGGNNGFVANTNASVAPPPPPPAHGGLSTTRLTVNESSNSSPNLADTTLRFAAVQTGTPAGLVVRVQYSTTPNMESSWTDLANGNSGHMTYDPSVEKFVLSSLNYPVVNGVYFRAIASASGYPDSISNRVGFFNLFSSKPRLTPPFLSFTGNGPFADLYFRAYVATPVNGMALRIQTSTTPFNENSWTDLNDGHSGHMTQSEEPKRFFSMVNEVPAGRSIYYRAIASRAGYADGISQPHGPLKVVSDVPPATNPITVSPRLSGAGSEVDPILVRAGTFTLSTTATAGSGHTVGQLSLLYDGAMLARANGSNVSQQYTTNLIGPHTVEAQAKDELGGISRGGTRLTHIWVIPSAGSAIREERIGGSTSAAVTSNGNVFTLVKDRGLWNDPTSWKDRLGKNGVPGPNDFAIINSVNTVTLSQNTTVKSIFVDGIINSNRPNQLSLTVTGIMTISKNGADILNIHLIIDTGATCEFLNTTADCLMTGSVENNGKFNVHGGRGIVGLLAYAGNGTTNFQIPAAVPAGAGVKPSLDTRSLVTTSAQLAGLTTSSLQKNVLADGSNLITNDGGSLITNDGGSLITNDGGSLITNDGGSLITNDGGSIVAQGGGNIVAQGGGNFADSDNSIAEMAATPAPSGILQTGGETNLNGVGLQGSVTLDGGVLSGSGVIYGNLTNNSGYIMPGHSPGAVGVTGNFRQGVNGTVVLEEAGKTHDKFDQLMVRGTATLGGNLELRTINGYRPVAADTFSPLGFASASGHFANISSNATVTVKPTGIITSVNPATASPVASRALNISTRAKVQTGDSVTIAGFIVTGPAGSNKKVIVRGLGPSLAAAGIQGALADPYIELRKGPTLLAANDNWRQRQTEVQASGIPPTNDFESAIVATLAPGAYTVTLRGAHNQIGVGLIEVYDLAQSSSASLANISTRCQVLTGDQVMIGGFILKGGLPPKVIIRAIGPSLAKAGVRGVLTDPVLELHDSNGMAITNDNWRATQESEIIATTIPPTDNREAAIVATLPPGPYTAIVRGANNTTGVALVEAYNLQ